jgi:hypothetical protein
MSVFARFHKLRSEALAKVDEVFAEPVQLLFLDKGREDVNRASCEIEAVLRVAMSKNKSATTASSARKKLFNAEQSTLNINRECYFGPEIKIGDRIRAVSRDGEPFFEILTIDDRSHKRLVLELGIL